MLLSLRAFAIIISTLAFIILHYQCSLINITNTSPSARVDFYLTLLDNIHKEKPYESILIIHQRVPPKDYQLEMIYQLRRPKVILQADSKFTYKRLFNTNILTVLIVYNSLVDKILHTAAVSLNYIRQTRILLIAVDVNLMQRQHFTLRLASLCHLYNMTNVLLHFLTTASAEMSQQYYYILQPYPYYHWHVLHLARDTHIDNFKYFPIHWRNMHNITLITLPDQLPPSNLLFEDSKGHLHINGNVARLILLFGELYNVSFQMHSSFKLSEIKYFTEITKMVTQQQLDIPMAVENDFNKYGEIMTDTYEISELVLMVPRAQPLTNREIFVLLLTGAFFKCLLISCLVLSIALSLMDYFTGGHLQRLGFILNVTAFPGVLGLPFATRTSARTNLRIMYLLIALVGLNFNSFFASNMNTLITSPPYHPQIYTYDDLLQSNVKILMYSEEATIIDNSSSAARCIIYHPNLTHVIEERNNFNTTYAYFMTTPSWSMLALKQQFHSQKAFHAPAAMAYLSMLQFGIILPLNSPLKEPLNYLIHRSHDVGLRRAWDRSTFSDMLKLKQISLRDPNPTRTHAALRAHDFYWIWVIWVIGLGVGFLVFIAELFCFMYV